jgi:hypothetical protein
MKRFGRIKRLAFSNHHAAKPATESKHTRIFNHRSSMRLVSLKQSVVDRSHGQNVAANEGDAPKAVAGRRWSEKGTTMGDHTP